MNIMKFSSLLTYIDRGDLIPLPSECHYWWNSDRVGIFLTSLYRGFPSGGLVFWTPPRPLPSSASEAAPYQVNYIVDGLQRITAIYSAFTGKPPRFSSSGNVENWPRFFHVGREEFCCTQGASDDPLCIDLATFFQRENGAGSAIIKLYPYASATLPVSEIARRVTNLHNLKNRSVPVEEMPREFTLTDCLEFRAMTLPPQVR